MIHLGPLAVPDGSPPRPPTPVGGARSPVDRSCSPSARSNGARTCRRWSPRSRPSSRDHGDARLVIAGAAGDDAAAVDAAVDRARSDRPARRRAAGAVDDATKAWLLRHARALAYPSLDEGFGFPILEAQQAGLPVVATRAGSIPEVAGDGAVLVPVGDGDALAGALASVLDDDARRSELIAAGRANVARFSWRATASALVHLYRRLRRGGVA